MTDPDTAALLTEYAASSAFLVARLGLTTTEWICKGCGQLAFTEPNLYPQHGADWHLETCTWRRAVEWVARERG